MLVLVSFKNNVRRVSYTTTGDAASWILNHIFPTVSLNEHVLRLLTRCSLFFQYVESDADEELLFNIPYVSLKDFSFQPEYIIHFSFSGRKTLFAFINHWEKSFCLDQTSQQKKWLSFSFTGSVKLKGIIISGEDDDSHPAEIRLWVSR